MTVQLFADFEATEWQDLTTEDDLAEIQEAIKEADLILLRDAWSGFMALAFGWDWISHYRQHLDAPGCSTITMLSYKSEFERTRWCDMIRAVKENLQPEDDWVLMLGETLEAFIARIDASRTSRG